MFDTPFIRVHQGKFFKNDHPYYFIGTNFWSAVNLAVENPKRLLRELDHLATLGITNLRIMALTEGPSSEPLRIVPAIQNKPAVLDETYLVGLDFLLVEMAKRNMHAVLCLNNFWPWSGGMSQYISWQDGSKIPYPPPMRGGEWWTYQVYTSTFYANQQAIHWYHEAIRQLICRTNTLNQLAYRDDPTIMAWQLANEPRASLHRKSYLKWIRESAQLIKSLAANHLVSLGSEGDTTHPEVNGVDVYEDHLADAIDYVTIHCWIQNWGWYDPKEPQTYPKAKQACLHYLDSQLKKVAPLKKPLVLEEFGIARDHGSYDDRATTTMRDLFFKDVFRYIVDQVKNDRLIAGANFWAWAGEGRPKAPKGLWKIGDELTGDPPHEHQGWYSIYDSDESTLRVIQAFTTQLDQFNQLLE
ncbi:MAG: glycoside hydrolase 5 family protein [Flammeovirgaceae bacterium]